MIVVAVLSLDFGLARAWIRSGSNPNLDVAFLFGLPMLNILAFGFVIGRRRQGRARAFWTSFTRLGWLAVAALAVDVLANRSRVLNGYEELITPVLNAYERYLRSFGNAEWHEDSSGHWLVGLPLIYSVTIPPLLLPALVGGWIFSLMDLRSNPKPASESE
jgi:hypothetical protein